ncbi:MAG TPA: 2-dehydro-3-deoxy-6-phosphogalactonate aldolase [Steroidobacteraceae bacterium]
MPADAASADLPIVAILRGLTPARAVEVASVLYRAGIRIIEVPLNSPDPFTSIARLAALQLADCLVGAGTVLSVQDVQRTHDAGGRLVVAPNCDTAVIRAALTLGMRAMPGVATATEAFQAIAAGASELKLFPAASYGPAHLQALKSVLPAAVRVLPVGGIGAPDIAAWLAVGAGGFGFGSDLFRAEYSLDEIDTRAQRLMRALAEARRAPS